MRMLVLCALCLASAVPTTAQTSGNRQSQRGSPTGTRGGFAARAKSSSAAEVFRKTAYLVGSGPDQILQQYGSDSSTCAITPKSYVALLMAEHKLHLDRKETLELMCREKTNSFAKALSSSGKKSPGAVALTTNDLRARERSYLRQINEAIKKSQ